MGRSKDNERIVLPCKFGKLVCEVVRDDDEYKEFAIDLYRDDGKVVQVCVIGTDEYELRESANRSTERTKQHDMVHVHVWDGDSQDCHWSTYVEPYGDGWWGEETI